MISHLEKYKDAIRGYIIKKTDYIELIKNSDFNLSKERCNRKIYHKELLPYSEPERKTRSGKYLSGNPEEKLRLRELNPYLEKLEPLLRERDFSSESLFRLIGRGINYCKMPVKGTSEGLEKNHPLNVERIEDRTIRIYYIQQNRPIIEEGQIVSSPGENSLFFSSEFISEPGGKRVDHFKRDGTTCGYQHQIGFSDIFMIKDSEKRELWYSPKEDFLRWTNDWAKMESKIDEHARTDAELERRKGLDELTQMTLDKLEPVEES